MSGPQVSAKDGWLDGCTCKICSTIVPYGWISTIEMCVGCVGIGVEMSVCNKTFDSRPPSQVAAPFISQFHLKASKARVENLLAARAASKSKQIIIHHSGVSTW